MVDIGTSKDRTDIYLNFIDRYRTAWIIKDDPDRRIKSHNHIMTKKIYFWKTRPGHTDIPVRVAYACHGFNIACMIGDDRPHRMMRIQGLSSGVHGVYNVRYLLRDCFGAVFGASLGGLVDLYRGTYAEREFIAHVFNRFVVFAKTGRYVVRE